MEPVRFIHITDTHLNAPGNKPLFKQADMADKLRNVFLHMQASQCQPAFVLITGDLTHDGDKEDYAYFRSLVDEASSSLGVPIYVALGNHDHREPFREGYLGEQASTQPYYYALTIAGMRLIVLNSQVEGRHHGEIDQQQMAWLAEELQESAPLGTVIALHHPLLNVNIASAGQMLANAEELAGVLKEGHVTGIFAGHVHSNNVGTYAGMLSVASSGTAFSGEMIDEGLLRLYDSCSYNIVTVSPSTTTVELITLPATDREFHRYNPALHMA
ncbi:metallophosphoesterase family protein [Paenibacillus senegalimassiliensis]|uniref:metallophosphoesterase family protein n=1 Tax=Paenibacillus senegalimassiliensis TaxID=1737426 RepID=UPI00073E9A21|nr:metallophosphoesterase [Paenibacillus senegalimassiliensis]